MLRKIALAALIFACAYAMTGLAVADWKHNGMPLNQNGTAEATGTFRWAGLAGTAECRIQEEFTLEPGTTGKIDAFGVDGDPTQVCKTTGFYNLFGCKVEEVDVRELPWTIHTTAPRTITVTNGQIGATLAGAFCPASLVTVEPGSYTQTVSEAEANAVKFLLGSGTVTAVYVWKKGEETKETVNLSSTTEILGAAAGTYGV